jgi:hypothetical protein
MLELRSVDDGHMYEVCLEEDGIRECCFVSSMHLVDEKEGQLKEAIKRRAFNAFIEQKSK